MKTGMHRPGRDRLERALIRLVVVIAAIVMLVQTLRVGDPLPDAVPVTSLERTRPSLYPASLLQEPVITFQLKNYSTLPLARVLVNGESRGEFRERYVTVFVREGDMLEVDGSRYSRPLDIEVLDVSKEVLVPSAGDHLRVEGGITCLGRVRLENR
ncbi:MAG: hypothetical protein PHT62_04375 [Desulfotomaculaceae bacterium]|nr:hypothetical protein [Desulfotomaculaceae bacterium]